MTFNSGDKVTYDLFPNKRNSPRGEAVFSSYSTKNRHCYIRTTEGKTIHVPLVELEKI